MHKCARLKILVPFLVVFFIAFATFSLTSCQEKGEIKIGVINSLTGSGAPYCEGIHNSFQLAVDEINEAGGIKGRKLVLLYEDDQTNPEAAVSAFQKLVDVDKVQIIIGPASSSSVMACAPLANDRKVVLLSSGAASPDITYAGDYIFRNRSAGTQEANATADFAYENLKLRKVGILKINTDYGQGFSRVFKEKFSSLGGEILGEVTYDQGQTDFRSQIVKIKNLNPEGVYLIGVPVEAGLILKQSAELGFNTRFLTNNMESPELIKIAGNATEGIYFAIPRVKLDESQERVKHFVEEYVKRYGEKPDMFAADAYDAVFIAKWAIEQAGYDGSKIKDALYQLQDFQGIAGSVSFDSNGDALKPLVIKTVRNREFVVVPTN